jgi:hypothetical protein
MAGLVPAIHVFGVLKIVREDVDVRDKRGHDGRETARKLNASSIRTTRACIEVVKTWMPGTRPGMTAERFVQDMTVETQCVSIRHGRA